MSATDEVVSAARELAALLRGNYMLPNTWPESLRFLAAVDALDGPAAADGPQSQADSQSQSPAERANAERANALRLAPNADDEPFAPGAGAPVLT